MASGNSGPSVNKGSQGLSTPWFIALSISFLLVFSNISFFYLYPLALDAIGTSKILIGWVMGIFSLATVLSRPLMGYLVSWKGERWTIWWGVVLMILASFSYTWIKEYGLTLLGIRIAHGIGFSAFVSGGFSLVARKIAPNRHAQAFGIVGAAIMAAAALAPSFGEVLIQKGGFSWVFIAAALSSLVSLLAVAILPQKQLPDQARRNPAPARYITPLKSRPYIYLLVVTLIFSHSQSTVFNFVALMAKAKGVESGRFFFLSFSLAIFLLLSAGKFIEKAGKLRVLKASYPWLALGVGLVPPFIGTSIFLIPALCFGCAMGLLFPTLNALAADHGGQEEKPAVMSIFTAVYDTGFITGGLISGMLSNALGLDALFGLTGFFALGGFLFLLLFTKGWMEPRDKH